MRPGWAWLLAALAAFCAGCRYFENINAQTYREYHAACWQAVVEACLRQQDDVTLPADPPAPRLCEDRVVPAYHGIIIAAAAERESWRKLRGQSQTALEFIAEMLEVLASRDVLNIEHLAPQIDEHMADHDALREEWRASRAGIGEAGSELQAAWQEVWPDNGFQFDLSTDAAALRNKLQPPPTAVRREALEHYYDNEYARLAMIYLDYEPSELPNPESHVPQGCEELSWALKRLEAALLVRYSMDRAIEADVGRIQELSRVDLSATPWDEIRIPEGRYARPRVTASIARLKLLKYLDTLLMNCLDVIVRDVDLHWRAVWPQHELETNIFAFAGLSQQTELPQDALSDLPDDPLAKFTFRE